MLRFLSVKRLAIIDAVEVEFDAGLNVLTGETGAGKSILVEAVGLLLGGRGSGDLVRTGEESASIEAIFESDGEDIVVRREITAQGRSRAFINGALATAGALKDLSSRLVELHGQHEHQTLLDPSTHLDVIDAFGGLERPAGEVAAAFETLSRVNEERTRLRAAVAERDARQEIVAFQYGELERAALRPGRPGDLEEDAALAAERQVLASAERIERLCADSYAALYESDASVLATLGGVWRKLGELAAIDPRFQPYLDARDGLKGQLEDLALFLRRYADSIEASPAHLQEVEERLALLERLKRKYGPTLADVIARRDRLKRELGELEHGDERLAALDRDHVAARAAYLSTATALSAERRRAAVDLGRQLQRLVAELAMEGTRFETRFGSPPLAEPLWTARGVDAAEFFMSPNPGEDLRPLTRVVSGGELSRVMLALKTLTFRSRLAGDGRARVRGAGAPGLVFDEVDAGIGGRVADVVGRKLRELGSAFQVLCITHLPQIAAGADTHFHIEKRVERGRTHMSVRRLSDAERVEELARMLGGEGVTDGLRASAREMLEERRGQAKGESERAKPLRPAARDAKARRAL